ncbi:hypothetical protein [Phenylobacterium sp.]|uniref:head-tail joining protein n=1 Tax=Phenylobacterium sp. TaxID=1871053 RepID=UPI002732E2E2|nr:hypothetical protein [Phenylobacterium sp.]MDP3853156.1 hypothetical protein [Phenylobacterium sp.]
MSALSERRARLLGALYRAYGEPASWQPQGGGPAIPLTIRRRNGEDVIGFGDSTAIVAVGELRVRKSELTTAQQDDLVTITETGEVLKVSIEPRLTTTGLEWLCEPIPVP